MPNPDQRAQARASLLLDDESLLRECEEEFRVASGPGGQHRNKTESGVRLKHLPTGIVISASERRSQHQNRLAAVERLRAVLTEWAREPVPRKKTRPTRGSKARRLLEKRRTSERKRSRSGWSD